MQQAPDKKKKIFSDEPRWIGPLALLIAFAAYLLIFGIRQGGIPDPLGAKGEGLLITLIFFVPIRVAFRFALGVRHRQKRRRIDHEL